MAGESEILVGGQAVLEGVMMKTPGAWAVTVRRSDGTLATRSGDVQPWSARWPVLKLPVLRGAAVLGQMLTLGMRALFFSSDVMAAEQKAAAAKEGAKKAAGVGSLTSLASLMVFSAVADGPGGDEDQAAREVEVRGHSPRLHSEPSDPKSDGLSKGELALAIGMAAAMFLLVFKALPLGIAWVAGRFIPALQAPLAESVISGLALAAVFVGYLLLMSRMKDVQRVFRYHGAEHQVVHVHEKGQEPTVANAALHPTQHPRCGTSFLFFVVLTSIVVWSLFPLDLGFAGKLALRLALFPLVLGLAYELIRLSARHRDNLFFRALMAPGLWSQRITTKPPDDSMREVALHSLALAQAR